VGGETKTFSVRTLGEVAAFFGVATQTVKQWRSGPDPMPGASGKYDLGEITRWRFSKTVLEPRAPDERREKLELEKLEAEVQGKQLRLRREAGELVDRAAAIARVTEMFNTVRQRLLALPEELASAIPQSVRSELVAELKHKMNLVCKEFESWSGDVES